MLFTPSLSDKAIHKTNIQMQQFITNQRKQISENDAILICLLDTENFNSPDSQAEILAQSIFDELSEGIKCNYARDIFESMTLVVDGLSNDHESRGTITLYADYDIKEVCFKLDTSHSSYQYLVYKLLSTVSYSAMIIDQAMEYSYLPEREYLPIIYEANVQREDGKELTVEDFPDTLCYALNEEYGLDPETIVDLVPQAQEYEQAFGEDGTHIAFNEKEIVPDNSDLKDPHFIRLVEGIDSVKHELSKLNADLQSINDYFEEADFAPLHFHSFVHTGLDIEKTLYDQLISQGSANGEEVAQSIALDNRKELESYLRITLGEICQVARCIDHYNDYAIEKGLEPTCK